jgi:hypothetical protein
MATLYWHPTGSPAAVGDKAKWESQNWCTFANGSGDFYTPADTDDLYFTGYDLTSCTTSAARTCASLNTVGGTADSNMNIPAVIGSAPTTLTLGGNLTVTGAISHCGGRLNFGAYTITCPVSPYTGKVGFTQTASGTVKIPPNADSYHLLAAGHLRLAWGAGVVSTIEALQSCLIGNCFFPTAPILTWRIWHIKGRGGECGPRAALPASPLQAFFREFSTELAAQPHTVIQQNRGWLGYRLGQIPPQARTAPLGTRFRQL